MKTFLPLVLGKSKARPKRQNDIHRFVSLDTLISDRLSSACPKTCLIYDVRRHCSYTTQHRVNEASRGESKSSVSNASEDELCTILTIKVKRARIGSV